MKSQSKSKGAEDERKREFRVNVGIAHDILVPLCGSCVLNTRHRGARTDRKIQDGEDCVYCEKLKLPREHNIDWEGLAFGKYNLFFVDITYLEGEVVLLFFSCETPHYAYPVSTTHIMLPVANFWE